MKEMDSVVVSSRKNSKNRQIYKYQECWKYFTNKRKIGWCTVGSNQCHATGHSLHFYGQELFVLLSVFYNLQNCKIAQRQLKPAMAWNGGGGH